MKHQIIMAKRLQEFNAGKNILKILQEDIKLHILSDLKIKALAF